MADLTTKQEPERTPPNFERQEELERLYQAGLEKDQNAPYKGVQIKTLGELEWVLQQRQWSGPEARKYLPFVPGNEGLEWIKKLGGVVLTGTNLSDANLSGLDLRGADLRRAILRRADLSFANLSMANLAGSVLLDANLNSTDLSGADLHGLELLAGDIEGAKFRGANLSGTYLSGNFFHAMFDRANLAGADFQIMNPFGANYVSDLREAIFTGADLSNAHLQGMDLNKAIFEEANLEGCDLSFANLTGANLRKANLKDANLSKAKLSEANLAGANLNGSDLRGAKFDMTTDLADIVLGDSPLMLADVTWGGTNLISVDWEPIQILGDEIEARKNTYSKDSAASKKEVRKSHDIRRDEWKAAVRAYRLLTAALRDQGMNEEADRFAYRARICQQQAFRYQHKRGRAFWYRFLDIIAGHGFRPERTVIAYVALIILFAIGYFFLGRTEADHLSPLGSLIFSITSFHGRGFFPGGLTLDDPVTVFAASEAIIGLFVEISFIATFTQRYFGR
jgi:uncharacterized protein YjbI with pentapeptide repeats